MRTRFFSIVILLTAIMTNAQQKKVASSSGISISNADLGTFPYFKTLPSFSPTDSITIEQNRTYLFDGKTVFTVDGKVSFQNLNLKDDVEKVPSEFQLVQEFDKLVATLGGKKVYEGKLPEDALKKLTDKDLVTLASEHQVAPYAFYGVVEYVIKTPEKEVWLQLVQEPSFLNFIRFLLLRRTTN